MAEQYETRVDIPLQLVPDEEAASVFDDNIEPIEEQASAWQALGGNIQRLTGKTTQEVRWFGIRLVAICGTGFLTLYLSGVTLIDHAAERAEDSAPAIGAGVVAGVNLEEQGQNLGAGFEQWLIERSKDNPGFIYFAEELTNQHLNNDNVIGKPKKNKHK